IKLATMLTGYEIDVYRDTEMSYEDDIFLDDFRDEIDGWVIDTFKNAGCVTAKSILNTPREELLEKTDLEEDTVDDVLAILRREYEDDEEAEATEATEE
ncbi:MAG: transcription termination/antitermination protein NusA, partial [Muribaculaceae bacterium]|nr:transcription termination/antitermination protein NusA [Muribaculaceae bacterium]